MRNFSQQRAQRDNHARICCQSDADDVFRKCSPLQLGFNARKEDDIGTVWRCVGGAELVLRPIDTTHAIEIDTNLGASNGEVVEHFGVDIGECGGPPLLGHVIDCRGCRVAGIVPTAEGHKQNGASHIGGLGPAQMGERVP
ncbi:unannotated protein [freshwater metagenome]|uniref:Unannotated protein n=1 Tax=freshwater metagenome TaxID=449393 RepID=A0A6J5YU94_9ZZZZ